MSDRTLLVCDGDQTFHTLLRYGLEAEGYVVATATSGAALRAHLDTAAFGLIVLELDLPDEDGLVLLRQLRTRHATPVLIVSRRADPDTVVTALELGANDFVAKPFDARAILLRIKALLRNAENQKTAAVLSKPRFAGWTLDLASRCLRGPDQQPVALTRSEFKLLAALVANAGRALSREQLLDAISMHRETASPRTIDVFIAKLRDKIEHDRRKPELIVTVHGFGYRFDGKFD